jgi:SPP1 family predicted phage head-tail adaptor
MTSSIKVGDLRRRVTIERPVRASDGGGGATVTWTLVAEVWAALWPRLADESVTLDRVAGQATHDMWIRYRTGITPEMRVTFGTRVFDIRGVIDVEDRNKWLRCPLEERDL